MPTSEGVGGEGALQEGQSPEDQGGHAYGECYQAPEGQHWYQKEDQDNWKNIADSVLLTLCCYLSWPCSLHIEAQIHNTRTSSLCPKSKTNTVIMIIVVEKYKTKEDKACVKWHPPSLQLPFLPINLSEYCEIACPLDLWICIVSSLIWANIKWTSISLILGTVFILGWQSVFKEVFTICHVLSFSIIL